MIDTHNPSTSMAIIDRVQPLKYRLLLASLLLVSVLSPLTSGSSLASLLRIIMLQVALVTSIVAARQHKRLFWIAVCLGVLAFSNISFEYVELDSQVRTSSQIFLTLFFSILGVTFLIDILRSPRIDIDQICGALCVYLIIGTVWSFLFALVLKQSPGAIVFPEETALSHDHSGTLTYFSFVTLTTLGYGDIRPVTPMARTLCWLEAVIGQIFMTVLVARLVGLNLASHAKIDPDL